MTERVMQFKDAMLQAIIDGRKTQTRRLVLDGACGEDGVFYACDSRCDPGDVLLASSPNYIGTITLRCLSVRVQRLQDITEQDAIAEGFESLAAFRVLWDSIYSDRAPMDSNPWVWAIGFEVIQ